VVNGNDVLGAVALCVLVVVSFAMSRAHKKVQRWLDEPSQLSEAELYAMRRIQKNEIKRRMRRVARDSRRPGGWQTNRREWP
jgi:hypothetical protein